MKCTNCNTDFCWVCGNRGYPSTHSGCKNVITDRKVLCLIITLFLLLPLVYVLFAPILLIAFYFDKCIRNTSKCMKIMLSLILYPIALILALLASPLAIPALYIYGMYLITISMLFFCSFKS